MMAIDKGMAGEAALMVEQGADLDASDKDGKTPLVMAIDKGMAGEAALMVERGAKLNVFAQGYHRPEFGGFGGFAYSDHFKHYGKTVLMMAITEGMATVAALMVERGAKLVKGCTDGRMVPISFALGRFNTPRRVFEGTVLCASGLRRRARFAAAAAAAGSGGSGRSGGGSCGGGSGVVSPAPAAGSVLQKLNSHGPHHATRFKRAIAVFAGVPLLGALPPEYVDFLAEARRRGCA